MLALCAQVVEVGRAAISKSLPGLVVGEPRDDNRAELVVGLFLDLLLGRLLLGTEVVGNELQGVGRDLELRRDNGLGCRDEAFAARLLVLVVVGAEDVVAALAGDAQRHECQIRHAVPDRRRVFLDNGKVLLDMAEAVVGHAVGPLYIGGDVAVWLLEVGHNWLAKAVVGCAAQVERLLAVRVRLVRVDDVRDDGVGDEVLSRLEFEIVEQGITANLQRQSERKASRRWSWVRPSLTLIQRGA